MNNRWLGLTSLTLLILITLWLSLLIWDVAIHPPINTQAQAVAIGEERLDLLFRISYGNAVIFTMVTTAWMTGLYMEGRHLLAAPWMLVGLIFVPVYTTLNLVAYGSQIMVVPAMVEAARLAPCETADLLLGWMVHLWPGSITAKLNGLAYAILGIPLIIFGSALASCGSTAKLAGVLLALSGLASIAGFAGIVFDSERLMLGTLIGGLLFWLSLFPVTWFFLKRAPKCD